MENVAGTVLVERNEMSAASRRLVQIVPECDARGEAGLESLTSVNEWNELKDLRRKYEHSWEEVSIFCEVHCI